MASRRTNGWGLQLRGCHPRPMLAERAGLSQAQGMSRTAATPTVEASRLQRQALDAFPARCAHHLAQDGRDHLTETALVSGGLIPAASRWRWTCCMRRATPLVVRFGARDEDRLVLDASKSPRAVLGRDRTPSIALKSAPSREARPDLVDHRELLLVGTGEADLRGVDDRRHAVAAVGQGGVAARQNAEEADRDVERIIVAVEAVGVEDVPGHLARERGAHLGHPRLDQRVPGLPHDRPTAEASRSRRTASGSP